MRKPLKILLLSIFMGACSSDPEEIEPERNENLPPEPPVLVSPEDNLFCTTNELDFTWLASTDNEGDEVTYTFEISSTSDFANVSYTRNLSSLYLNKEVARGQNYYWRVIAIDQHGNSSNYSNVRNFFTEGAPGTNSLPSVPELISPEEDVITGTEVTLTWDATDADNDELTFDLYFGTSEPPELYMENLFEHTYIINNLNPGNTYFWKIIVKDENGGKTIGQTWNFKTSG